MNKRVLFVAPGPFDTWASSRLRGLWPARCIPGAQIVNIEQGIVPEADIYVWIKKTSPQYLARPGVHIWDVCDPVWWFQPEQSAKILQSVDAVVASNAALAADFEDWSMQPCRVIPDRLDLQHYAKQREHGDAKPLRLIWYGASQNRVALFAALPTLERLKANGFNFELTVLDDAPHNQWALTSAFPVYYAKWTLDTENEVIAAHDIAILPPYPGRWGEVKSNNKTLTAWACGLPVADGVNYEQLRTLALFKEARIEQAALGRRKLVAEYNVKRSGVEWMQLVNELAGEGDEYDGDEWEL